MISDIFKSQIQSFITNSEFEHFKRVLDGELNHLRNIIDIQKNQINLLFSQRQKTSDEIGENWRKSQQLQKQNNGLKERITKMEEQIKNHRTQVFCRNNRLPNNQVIPQQFNKQQPQLFTKAKQLQTDKSQAIQNIQLNNLTSKEDSTHPFIVDNRKTKTNQEALEEDDDDEIICSVWCSSPKEQPKKGKHSKLANKSAAHENEFTVSEHENIMRVRKLRGQGFLSPAQNFIYSEPLPIGEVSYFTVNKIRIRDNFFVGIGSSSIFGLNNAFRHRDCLAYSSNGYLWSGGDSTKVPMQQLQQLLIQQIEVKVDRNKNMVIFSSNGSEIARTNIPIHLINKELFTTIILFNKDDTVDISALNLQI